MSTQSPASPLTHVSDTAFWMATYRAQESARPNALFRDPLAQLLVGERGQNVLRTMRRWSRYAEWTLVIRTRIIDELITQAIARDVRTIVNLGAGLDTRPYRLGLPPDLRWIEVDFPHLIQWKQKELIGHPPRCRLERMECDLSQRSARRALLTQLGLANESCLILTEGVIPYLDESTVNDLSEDIAQAAPHAQWVAEYYSPLIYPHFRGAAFRRSLGEAPFRFFPADGLEFFAARGWRAKEVRYLYDAGEAWRRPFPLPWFARALRIIAPKERFNARMRMQAYVLLTRG